MKRRPRPLPRPIRILGRVLRVLVGILLVLFVAAYAWISYPTLEHNTLPPELVSMDSPEGKAWEAEATKADLALLLPRLQSQEKRSWCGVASAATVLSAMRGNTTLQADVLAAARSVRPGWKVTFGGMNLDQLAAILRANGVTAEAVHADEVDVDAFRAALVQNMADPEDAMIANFDRVGLHQDGSGHLSPVGAVDLASDRVLVLDVATLRYPPVWVDIDLLYAAMRGTDPGSGRSRGWVEVRP